MRVSGEKAGRRSRRLGEILVAHGLITVDQLRLGLENQLVAGGRLGTVLVQMELVPLDQVSRCLSEQLGVPEATHRMLEDATPEALRLLTRDFCMKNEICPFFEVGPVLHLAMTRPTPTVVDEVSYHLGRKVMPHVVPELRLYYFLERHYGIKRTARFLRLPEPEQRPDERRGFVKVSIAAEDDEGEEPARDRPPRISGRMSLDAAASLLRKRDHQTGPTEPTPVSPVLEALSTADTGRAIAAALVAPDIAPTRASVLLWVRDNVAIGSRASGTNVTAQQLGRLVVSLEKPSLLYQAMDSSSVIHALAHRFPAQRRIASFLGLHKPGEVLVAPVLLRHKVVCLLLLYTEAGASFPAEAAGLLAEVAHAGEHAYRRLANSSLDSDQSLELLRLENEHLRDELSQSQKARDALMHQVMALNAEKRQPTDDTSRQTFRYLVAVIIMVGLLAMITIAMPTFSHLFDAKDKDQPPTRVIQPRPRPPAPPARPVR